MAPRYVRDFAARTAFASPDRDVFGGLEKKLARLHREPLPRTPGIALLGDARDAADRAKAALRQRGLPDRARLVVTSPPYLRVVKYGYYNWLRTWLLGEDARAIDAALDDAHHREPYLVFLREVLADLRSALADDAVVVLVIGDVETDRGRPEDDEAVGRRGGSGHEDRSDPRPGRDRGGPTPGPRGREDADRLGVAAARAAGPVRNAVGATPLGRRAPRPHG
jgi:hypothetical protein